jgi:hypothetical protein
MKKFLLPFLLLLLIQSLPAQRVTVSEALSIRNDVAYDIIGDLRGRLLLFRDRNTDFEVQAFDDNMKLDWEKEIELDKRRPQVMDLITNDNDFCILYNFRWKNDAFIKIHRYSPSANLIDSTTVAMMKSPLHVNSYQTVLSEDRNMLLLFRMDNQRELETMVFDIKRMQLLWERVVAPEDMVFNRDFGQLEVDNEGNMYLALLKENRRFNSSKHYLEFFQYGPTTDMSLQRYIVPMADFMTFTAAFSFDNLNKTLVAGGLYSDDNRGRAVGTYYLSLDPAGPGDYILHFHPFDDKFVATFLGKDFDAKNRGITETDVREIIHRQDGGILLIAERNRIYERHLSGRTFNSDMNGRSIIDYHFDDVFVMSYHPDGTPHWQTILHKKQYSQDDDAIYSSFFLMKTPSSLRVLFNDEIKYENTVSEYVIRGNGSFDRNSVMSTENQQLRLRFPDALQIATNSLIIPSERRNRLKLVKVTY